MTTLPYADVDCNLRAFSRPRRGFRPLRRQWSPRRSLRRHISRR
ncbi:unnamed protein product [Brassica napus]|nr:unnamed protein product [Brassica napus]